MLNGGGSSYEDGFSDPAGGAMGQAHAGAASGRQRQTGQNVPPMTGGRSAFPLP